MTENMEKLSLGDKSNQTVTLLFVSSIIQLMRMWVPQINGMLLESPWVSVCGGSVACEHPLLNRYQNQSNYLKFFRQQLFDIVSATKRDTSQDQQKPAYEPHSWLLSCKRHCMILEFSIFCFSFLFFCSWYNITPLPSRNTFCLWILVVFCFFKEKKKTVGKESNSGYKTKILCSVFPLTIKLCVNFMWNNGMR